MAARLAIAAARGEDQHHELTLVLQAGLSPHVMHVAAPHHVKSKSKVGRDADVPAHEQRESRLPGRGLEQDHCGRKANRQRYKQARTRLDDADRPGEPGVCGGVGRCHVDTSPVLFSEW
jgi:hypothetical protein